MVLRITVGALLAAAVWCGMPAQGHAQVKPEPAWCGGSWQPASMREVAEKDGKISLAPIAGTAGTNFGSCVATTRTLKDKDGKDQQVSVPTYPAYPASAVTFRADEKTGAFVGGTMVTEKDKDGKDVRKWAPIQPTVVKLKK